MPSCAALGCRNYSRKPTPHVSYHRLPKDPIIAAAWKKAIDRIDYPPNIFLCSNHFDDASFDHSREIRESIMGPEYFRGKQKLLPNAVPTIFFKKKAEPSESQKDFYRIIKESIGKPGTSRYCDNITKYYKNKVSSEKYDMIKRILKTPDRKLSDSQYSQSSNISPSHENSFKEKSSHRHMDTNHNSFLSLSGKEKNSKIKNESLTSTIRTHKENNSPTSFPDSKKLLHQKLYEENINYNLHLQDLQKKSTFTCNTTKAESSEINSLTKKGSTSESNFIQEGATKDSNTSIHSHQKPFYHTDKAKDKYDSQKNEDLVHQKMLLMQYKKNNAILAQNINTLYMLNQLNTATPGMNPQLISPISPLTGDNNQTISPLTSLGPSLNHVISPCNVFSSDFKSQSNLFTPLVSPCNSSHSSPPASEIYLRNLKQKTDKLGSPPQSFPPASDIYLRNLKHKTDQVNCQIRMPSDYDNSVIDKIQSTDVEELIFLKNAVDSTLQKKFAGSSENNLSVLSLDGKSATHSVKSLFRSPDSVKFQLNSPPFRSKISSFSESKSNSSINLTKDSLHMTVEKPNKLSLSDYHNRRNQWNIHEPTKSSPLPSSPIIAKSSPSLDNNRLLKSQSQSSNSVQSDQTPSIKLETQPTVNKSPEKSPIDSNSSFCTNGSIKEKKFENTHIEDEYLEFMKSITNCDIVNNKDEKEIQSSPVLDKVQSLQYLPENKSDQVLKNKVVEQFAFNSIRADTPSATVTLQQAKISSKCKKSTLDQSKLTSDQLFSNNKVVLEKNKNVIKIEDGTTIITNVSPSVSVSDSTTNNTQVTTMDASEVKKANMQQKTKYKKPHLLVKSVETMSVPNNPNLGNNSHLSQNDAVKAMQQKKGIPIVEKITQSNQVKLDKKVPQPSQQKIDVKAEKGFQPQKTEDVVKVILQPQQKNSAKVEKIKQPHQQKDFPKVEKIPHQLKSDIKVEKSSQLNQGKGFDIVKLILQLQQQKVAKVEKTTQSYQQKTDEKCDQVLQPNQQKADEKVDNNSQKHGDKVVKLVLQLHQKKGDDKEAVNSDKSSLLKNSLLNQPDLTNLNKKKLTDQLSMLAAKKKVKLDTSPLVSKTDKPVSLSSFSKNIVKESIKKKDGLVKKHFNDINSDSTKESRALKPHMEPQTYLSITDSNIVLEGATLTESNKRVKKSSNKIGKTVRINQQNTITTSSTESNKDAKKILNKVGTTSKVNKEDLTSIAAESNKNDNRIDTVSKINLINSKSIKCKLVSEEGSSQSSCKKAPEKENLKLVIKTKGDVAELLCKPNVHEQSSIAEVSARSIDSEKMNKRESQNNTDFNPESQMIDNTEFNPEVEPLVLGKRRSKATLKKKAYYEYLRKREARHKAAKEAAEKQRRIADAQKQAKHLKKRGIFKNNQTLQEIKNNETVKSCSKEDSKNDVSLTHPSSDLFTLVHSSPGSNQSVFQKDITYQCKKCVECFTTISSLTKHLLVHDKLSNLEQIKNFNTVDEKKSFVCTLCSESTEAHYNSIQEYCFHLMSQHSLSYEKASNHIINYSLIPKHPKKGTKHRKKNLDTRLLSGSEILPQNEVNNKKPNVNSKIIKAKEVIMRIKKVNLENQLKAVNSFKINNGQIVQSENINTTKVSTSFISDALSTSNFNANAKETGFYETCSINVKTDNTTNDEPLQKVTNLDIPGELLLNNNDISIISKVITEDTSENTLENTSEPQTSKKVTNLQKGDPFNKIDDIDGFEKTHEEEKQRMKSQFISAERTARMLVRNRRKNLPKTQKSSTGHNSSDSRKDYITIEQLDALKVKVRVNTSVATDTVGMNDSFEANNVVITNNKRSKKSKKRKFNHKKTSKKPSDQPAKKKRKYYVYEHELYDMQTEPNLINSLGIDSSNFSKTSNFNSISLANHSELFNQSENEKILATHRNINYDPDYDYKNQTDVFLTEDIFLTEDEITSSLLTLNDTSIDADTLERIHESHLRILQYDVKQALDDIIALIIRKNESNMQPNEICRSMTPCPYQDHEYFFQSKIDHQVNNSLGVSENIFSNGMCDVSNDICDVSNDICDVSNDTCGVSNNLCRVSNDMCDISNDICDVVAQNTSKNLFLEFQKNESEKLQFLESSSVSQIESALCPSTLTQFSPVDSNKLPSDSCIDFLSLESYIESPLDFQNKPLSCSQIESPLYSQNKPLSCSQIESSSIHIESDFNSEKLSDFETKMYENKSCNFLNSKHIKTIENNLITGNIIDDRENIGILNNNLHSDRENICDVQHEVKSLLKELLDNISNHFGQYFTMISKNGNCSNITPTDAIFDCSDKSTVQTLYVPCCLGTGDLSMSAEELANEYGNNAFAIKTKLQLNNSIFENFSKENEIIDMSKKNTSECRQESQTEKIPSLMNLYNLKEPFSIDSKILINFDRLSPICPTNDIPDNFGEINSLLVEEPLKKSIDKQNFFFNSNMNIKQEIFDDDDDGVVDIHRFSVQSFSQTALEYFSLEGKDDKAKLYPCSRKRLYSCDKYNTCSRKNFKKMDSYLREDCLYNSTRHKNKSAALKQEFIRHKNCTPACFEFDNRHKFTKIKDARRSSSLETQNVFKNQKKHTCKKCNAQFPSLKVFCRHQMFFHRNSLNDCKCLICGQSFLRRFYLHSHLKKHSEFPHRSNLTL